MADATAPKIEYGVTALGVMASMAGLDFVRAMFAGRLPPPPIMQTIEPFDQTAEPGIVVFHSVPGFRHYNPIGSVHGGYAATLLDSAMGLAVHTALPAGTGYTTLNSRSLHQGLTENTGPVRSEGRAPCRRRAATAATSPIPGPPLAHATTTCRFSRLRREREPLTPGEP
jgi:acyl-coenzyme A thioesterase PaaI-like protein